MPPKSPPPLARASTPEAMDWDHVERRDAPRDQDALGLSAADRAALGLSVPRTQDFQPGVFGDAQEALAEVLAAGGAVGKRSERPRRRT